VSNTIKTTLLLGLLTGLIMGFGSYLGGSQGLVIAFVFAGLMNFGAFWFSDTIVLKMYHARPVDAAEAPDLYRIVHGLVSRAQMPMPRLYLLPQEAPNAFATGRSPQHAAVAVTEGLLRLMSAQEVEGVLAHELGHVKNRDTLISTVAATLAGVVMMLANMLRWAAIFGGVQRDEDDGGGIAGLLVMTIVAPIAAMLIQFAISRSREFQADATGAELSGNPLGLASALEKLAFASERIPMAAQPQTAHLFIVNPLGGSSLARMFSTHPPIEERVRRLRAMATGSSTGW
jgi:heat shock protein HtpX